MDWDAWAQRAEKALAFGGGADWKELFAPGAVFSDPNTTTPTNDLKEIARDTRVIFPDWTQEITTIRGGDRWAVFEWIGRATYTPVAGNPGAGAPVEIHGATIVEIDGDGLVTSWRDYLDRKEPEDQIRRHVKDGRAEAT
ncbi:MAG TPA: nuclear transport factor 2 family protein [Acidimicrobiales bacterium]|nr:nuclear transport factor 2 family protein [Acidimicrobiales bacterium]